MRKNTIFLTVFCNSISLPELRKICDEIELSIEQKTLLIERFGKGGGVKAVNMSASKQAKTAENICNKMRDFFENNPTKRRKIIEELMQ